MPGSVPDVSISIRMSLELSTHIRTEWYNLQLVLAGVVYHFGKQFRSTPLAFQFVGYLRMIDHEVFPYNAYCHFRKSFVAIIDDEAAFFLRVQFKFYRIHRVS